MTLGELASTARSGAGTWLTALTGMSGRQIAAMIFAVVAFQFCDDVLWRLIDFIIDHGILPHVHWLNFLADN